jgi:hypothetical protein
MWKTPRTRIYERGEQARDPGYAAPLLARSLRRELAEDLAHARRLEDDLGAVAFRLVCKLGAQLVNIHVLC